MRYVMDKWYEDNASRNKTWKGIVPEVGSAVSGGCLDRPSNSATKFPDVTDFPPGVNLCSKLPWFVGGAMLQDLPPRFNLSPWLSVGNRSGMEAGEEPDGLNCTGRHKANYRSKVGVESKLRQPDSYISRCMKSSTNIGWSWLYTLADRMCIRIWPQESWLVRIIINRIMIPSLLSRLRNNSILLR